MNAISIQKDIIEIAISNMQNAINKKDDTDIASNILIETIDNKVVLKSTDHEVSMKLTIEAKEIQGYIKCAVNGGMLNNIIKALSDEEVILELEEDEKLILKQGTYKVKIPIYDIDDIPFKLNFTKMEQINIDNEFFLQGIKKIYHSCAEPREMGNIATQGVLLEVRENKLFLVATDTRRCSFISKEYNEDSKNIYCIIPKKSINEITKIFAHNNDFEIYIRRSKDSYNDDAEYIDSMGFIGNGIEFYTKLINSRFPPYEKVISKNPEAKCIKIQKTPMLKALNQINITSSRVKITFDINEISLDSVDEDKANASKKINAQTGLEEEMRIALTSKHIIECLSNTKYEEVLFYITDPHATIFVDLQDYQEIIVPQIL